MLQQHEHYYHYTSKENRDNIFRQGRIRAGRSGKVYLSPTRYGDAQIAMEELGIIDKVVECGIQIQSQLLPDTPSTSIVQPVIDHRGRVLRSGGGLEIALDSDLSLLLSTFDLL